MTRFPVNLSNRHREPVKHLKGKQFQGTCQTDTGNLSDSYREPVTCKLQHKIFNIYICFMIRRVFFTLPRKQVSMEKKIEYAISKDLIISLETQN